MPGCAARARSNRQAARQVRCVHAASTAKETSANIRVGRGRAHGDDANGGLPILQCTTSKMPSHAAPVTCGPGGQTHNCLPGTGDIQVAFWPPRNQRGGDAPGTDGIRHGDTSPLAISTPGPGSAQRSGDHAQGAPGSRSPAATTCPHRMDVEDGYFYWDPATIVHWWYAVVHHTAPRPWRSPPCQTVIARA